MKRKALAIVLTLLMLVSVLPMGAFAASYSDTEGHWAEASIDRWTDAKVLEGMGLVEKKKIGKEAFHTVNLERLLELSNAQH